MGAFLRTVAGKRRIILLWLQEIMIRDGNPTNLGSFLIAIVAIVLWL